MSKESTSSDRIVKNGSVSWNNYEGNKGSHNIQATQMNVKDISTGDHKWYNTQSGKSGVALGTERERDWKK